MSTYVMSDIHGCYGAFMLMLRKIQFNKNDILICAGDYIDRGNKNFEMLNWIMHAPDNVIMIRGNHDEEYAANIDIMRSVCEKIKLDKGDMEEAGKLYQIVCEFAKENNCISFDYYGTVGQLINENRVTFSKLCQWTDKIKAMPYFYKLEEFFISPDSHQNHYPFLPHSAKIGMNSSDEVHSEAYTRASITEQKKTGTLKGE